MKKLSLALVCVALVGCARFSTKQTDISYETGTQKPTRSITTKASAYTFLTAKSELSKFKALQTDKSQSASVGTLNQSAGEPTNTLAVIEAIVTAAIRAAK